MKKSKGLSGRQLDAVRAVLEYPTIEAAAKAAGCSRSTLNAWLETAEFKTAVDKARSQTFAAGLDVLKSGTMKAVRTLIALLDSRNENIRRLTAGMILDFNEVQDFEARIERLEELLKVGPN